MEIRYFSWLRNRMGVDKETLALPSGITTLKGLTEWLSGREQKYQALFSYTSVIRASVNGDLAEEWGQQKIADDDTITFFAPMAGG